MAAFDTGEIKSKAKSSFTEAWIATAKLIPTGTEVSLAKKGKPHLVRELIQKSRQILLNLGFDEVENLTLLPDSDVVKQYGPEARVILDRAFYLAELPRPDIGLSARRIAEIKKIAEGMDIGKLQTILRRYKKGEIEADNLIEELIAGLGITDYQATELLDRVFPEIKELQPVPSNKTLRSHMTATWFHTLAALQDKASFPVALFSVGPRSASPPLRICCGYGPPNVFGCGKGDHQECYAAIWLLRHQIRDQDSNVQVLCPGAGRGGLR
jgi:O-phosphoseryl-tRNA synthetase